MADGRRPGRPKGSKGRKTLDDEAARELIKARVREALGPMLDAQIANAAGISYLVLRNKTTGKFVRVSGSMAKALSESADAEQLEKLEIWEKDPNVNAWMDLCNRAFGKPKETVDVQVSGEVHVIEARLNAGRARVAAARRLPDIEVKAE